MSWMQSLGYLLGTVTQNAVYAATVNIAVGAVFWMTAGFFGVAAVLVM